MHAPNVASSSVVEVWVERLDPLLGEDFGWQREPDAIIRNSLVRQLQSTISTSATSIAARSRANDLLHHREFEALIDERLIDHIYIAPTLWEGSVTLSQSPDRTARYRLAVAEYEEYLVDDSTPYDKIPTKKDKRRGHARRDHFW